MAVGVATAVLIIVQSWLITKAVTGVFDQLAIPAGWVWLVAALAAVFAVRAGLSWLNSLLAHRSVAAVKSQLRRDLVKSRATNPVTGEASSATFVHVTTTGLDALDGYFSKYLPQLGLAVTVPFLVGAAMLVSDWLSAVIVAVTLPLIPLFMALIGWTTETATKRSFATMDRLANHFADLIEGLPTLQAFARARAQRKGIELSERRYRQATMRVLYVSFLSAFALELLATLSVAVVAVTVGFRLVDGGLTFASALFVLILAPEAFLPVRQVGVHFHDSVDGMAAADAAFEIIDSSDPESGHDPVEDLSGETISLRGVFFRHRGSNEDVLRGVDLALAPGEVTALAGPSGGGKSTLLGLLMGFVVPDSGQIMLGATKLGRHDAASWRRQVAWVAQEPGLVHGTVGDNVLLGDPTAGTSEVEAALRLAGAAFGPGKPVGDDGEGLSGGERRRVAVARALLRVRSGNTRLLILDEPTAGLDHETESVVIDAVRASGVGALIVTHRPAVLAACDRVVELQDGRVRATSRDGQPHIQGGGES